MDKEKVLEIIKKGESSKVEFKLDDVHPDSLAAEIIAFSNLDGGLIILGVDDSGNIKGIKRENIEEWVINICRNNCDPSIIP
ncbi:MAG: helix-turn-helix domain-containing protein, partial [Methanosarcinales archaeon]